MLTGGEQELGGPRNFQVTIARPAPKSSSEALEWRMKKWLEFFSLWMCCFFLIPSDVQGQVGEASLAGLVSDRTGAVIPQAKVALQGEDGALVRSVTSRQDGTYLIPTLLPGRYTLTVSAGGFETQRTRPFDLTSGQTAAINFSLKVASSSAQVTVEDIAPVLQTTSESIGTTLSSTMITSIPLLGRSFLNAISLAPGVVPVPPAGSTTNHSPVSQSTIPSVFGQRQKDNNFLMDGVENRDPNLLGVAIYPPPDAIREMTVDSGVGSSAFGHASGATIDVVTKSGTPSYHGTLWEYWRNNILDAKTYFTPSVGTYHWNQFGAEAGGPLLLPWLLHKRNKWYAYGYYEGVRINSPANYLATVPTPAEVSGDFSADAPSDMSQCKTEVVTDSAGRPFCALVYNPFVTADPATGTYTRRPFDDNKIPASMINPSAAAIANYYPKPNYSLPGQSVNWINQSGNHTYGNQWDARVDHQFGERHSFFARYTGASNPNDSVGLPGVNAHTTDQLVNAVASDTYVPTKSLVLTARYGVTGVNYFTGNSSPAGLPQSSGLGAVFPTFLGSEILPPISFDSYTGIPANDTTIGPVFQHSGIVDVQRLAGRHTISFGGAIVHTHEEQGSLASTSLGFLRGQTGDLVASVPTLQKTSGNAFASFLLGVPDSAARQLGGAFVDQTTYGYGLYLQDTWRNGRLTLNGGIRYDYNAPPVNSYGLGTFYYEKGTYVFDLKNPITGAAATIRRGGITPDRNNFAPRFGFAYQVTPSTVVRASAGIFYDSFGSNYIQASQSAAGNWPFSSPQTISHLNATGVNAVLPNPFANFGDPVGSPTTTGCSQCLNVYPASSRTPYVSEWTLSVQKQFGQSLGVEVAYFGSKGSKLTAQMLDNIAPEPSPNPKNLQTVRFPGRSPWVLNGYNEFNSNYNGLAVRVQRQYDHGLSYLVAYTYSKNIDQVDNLSSGNIYGTATENPTRWNGYLNRGLAGFDITHVLSMVGVWKIPGRTHYRLVNGVISGWELSDILTLHSGMPYSVYISGDNENVGTIFGRQSQFPQQVGNTHIGHRTPAEWFNTAAFVIPAYGTRGNVMRNPAELKSGGLVNNDMTLGKVWNIYRENTKFELRGEFFNLFNHTNFGFPGQTVGSTNFGQVSSTLNSGRTVQLAGKIHF
jgi:Carboxypeptidase regulatory-like domain